MNVELATCSGSQDTHTKALVDWVAAFDGALIARDIAAVTGLFHETGFWRDFLVFGWNLTTSEGHGEIAELLHATLEHAQPRGWKLEGNASESGGVIEGWLSFETAQFRGKGHVRLRDGKIWTLLTTAQELKGFEEKRGHTRPLGAQHGHDLADKRSWLERRKDEQAALGITEQPYVLVVGGGQSGLALGARLKRLDVPTLIIDKTACAGDQWRSRYKSLCLHDPVWYDHMPYIPFPEHWPVFTPKDQIGDWLEMYAKVMELNTWYSTRCVKASFDEAKQRWDVEVSREGKHLTLHPTHLVLATGNAGMPNVPTYPGAGDFAGQQHHSSEHPGGNAWRGKRVVVIGSNNSAHDICGDLYENGADVTMVQRSATAIVRSETLMDVVMQPLYSETAVEAGVSTEKADLTFASIPYRVLPEIHRELFNEVRRRDRDFYDRLERVGFLLDFGEDESGVFLKYLRRASGYYIDVGASELIADGKIKLRSGLGVHHIESDGVVLEDGSKLPADLIVYATGFSSMTAWAAQLISQEVADKVGPCWGYGSGTTRDPGPWEGELRNMWKPTRQQNLWFHGGNLHQSRHYSLYLALQLKGRLEGLSTPVYRLEARHHVS